MADNTTLNLASTAGDVIATDDIAGVKYQIVKIGHGLADAAPVHASATNPLPAVALQNGVVSTVNSSAVALGIGVVFTGTSEDETEQADVRVSVFTDQASATDGLQMQQSSNGTNWDIVDAYTVPANAGKTFSVGVSAKFFRIVYTNGAVAQTVFRLQVKYHKTYSKGSSVRPQDARTNDNDMEEQLAHLLGFNGVSWDRLRSTIANGLAVDVSRIVAALPTGANVIGGVTGTFFQATQPVSMATNTPTLAAGTAIAGKFGIDQTTPGVTNLVTVQPSTLAVTVTAAANTAATATLPAVAGQFHYITGIEIMRTSTAALAGTATLVVTTTNLSGGLAWSFGNAMAAGATQRDLLVTFENPLKSSVVNTATTIVMPLPGAAVLWRANVYYFTAA